MDRLRAIARVALGIIVMARGGVLRAQAIQPAVDPRQPPIQAPSENPNGAIPPAVVVHLTTVLRLLGEAPESPPPIVVPDHDASIWMFGTAAAVDWATTAHSLAFHHGHEDNPLINWTPTPAATIATGAAIDAAGVVLWERLMRDHPRTAAIGLYVASALRLLVAVQNEYRIAHAGTCALPPPCQLNCRDVFDRCR
jgi:hypothetical protein